MAISWRLIPYCSGSLRHKHLFQLDKINRIMKSEKKKKMNFEPNKFFIGLMDFFSILLPGALLTYIIKDKVFGYIMHTNDVFILKGTEHSLIFLFVSYLLGHFIFLVGAKFIDDLLYEKINSARFSKQLELLLLQKKLRSKFLRWLAHHFFKIYADRSLKKVLRIKTHYLDSLLAVNAINAFQWSKTRLNLNHPAAFMEVQRHEANSKFFRSLLVVFCFLVPWSLWFGRWGISLAILSLIILASWRYIDQRMKSVRLAYWYIISLEAADPKGFREKAKKGKTKFTHAGGIVFKGAGANRKYLLVKTKKPPYVWVLPKGHIESGESTKEAAMREVKEETGVWARIVGPLGTSKFKFKKQDIKVKYYQMEALEKGKAIEKREQEWFVLDEALRVVEHEDNKRLLMKFKNNT